MFVDVQYVSMKKCEQKYTKKYTKRYIKKYTMFMKEYSAVLSFQWVWISQIILFISTAWCFGESLLTKSKNCIHERIT